MKIKTTTVLLKELSSIASFDEFVNKNKDFMLSKSIAEHLNDLLKEKGLAKAEVIKKSELNENYAYQLFSGLKKSPTRDKLICIAIGMQLTADETNGLLKLAGMLPLYPKNIRDSLILFGINKGYSVCRINEMLFDKNENTLG